MSLLIFKIQQMSWGNAPKDANTIDGQYWKNQGWIDPRRTFYIPIQSSPVKVTLARLTGAAISRFVT